MLKKIGRVAGLCLIASIIAFMTWEAFRPAPAGAQGVDKHSVSLTCTASVSPNITGYNFYRGLVTGGPYAKQNAALVTACAYTDTTGTGGTTYFYVATAVDSSGSESVFSNEVSATFLGLPAAPTALKAVAN